MLESGGGELTIIILRRAGRAEKDNLGDITVSILWGENGTNTYGAMRITSRNTQLTRWSSDAQTIDLARFAVHTRFRPGAIEVFFSFAGSKIGGRRACNETIPDFPGMSTVVQTIGVVIAVIAADNGGATVAVFCAVRCASCGPRSAGRQIPCRKPSCLSAAGELLSVGQSSPRRHHPKWYEFTVSESFYALQSIAPADRLSFRSGLLDERLRWIYFARPQALTLASRVSIISRIMWTTASSPIAVLIMLW